MVTTAAAPVATKTGSLDEQVVKTLGFQYDLVDVHLTSINEDSSKHNYRLTRLDQELALQYGIAMENGANFPPIVIHDEPNVKGYVVDSGVHRYHGRRTTNFKTISAIRLKNLNLNNPTDAQKLDELRVRLNLTHGRGLDQVERKQTACNWIASGTMTESQAAQFFDLDEKVLHDAYEVYLLDMELLRFQLHPENFVRTSDKRAVLRQGLSQSDMRELERILVRYTAEDVKKKITSTQFRELAHDISECRGVQAQKEQVFDAFRATFRQHQTTKKKGHGRAEQLPQTARLNNVLSHVRALDVATLSTSASNSVSGQNLTDDIYSAMLKLAKLHDSIANKYGLPQVSLNR